MAKLEYHEGRIAHGHSRLIWLTDEVDAHLIGLIESNGERFEPITAELERYWRELRDELAGHLRMEEEQIFTRVEANVPGFSDEIAILRTEHAELAEQIQALSTMLHGLRSSPFSKAEVVASRAELKAFRDHFSVHSRHERDVLSRVEEFAHAH